MTKISKSKHITKHGIVKKNPRKRVKIDYDFIVDEIFFMWDDVYDDGRKGIEHGTTGSGQAKYEDFIFDKEPNQNFHIKVGKYLRAKKVKYEWGYKQLKIFYK